MAGREDTDAEGPERDHEKQAARRDADRADEQRNRASGHRTGEEQAAVNRELDPPA